MNRAIVEPLEQLKAVDVCRTNLFSMVGLGKLSQAILGDGPFLNNLACVPDSPASLKVFLQEGEIYALEDIDTTAYGPLPSDTTHQILKQGLLLDPLEFTLTPPTTPGNSVNYLIQVTYEDSDTNIENRPFFNQPAQNVATVRSGLLSATLKAGISAPTGSQITPTPDTGYVGAWVVTVSNGQTQIIAGDINKYPNAPFIDSKLPDKLDEGAADVRYGQITQIQAGAYLYATATGTANALIASISPNINSLYEGMEVHIKISATNTGAATLNLNGLGIKNIISTNGNALVGGEMPLDSIAIIAYDGTSFRLQNPSVKYSLSTNGYTYLPGGLLLQWGSATIPASGDSVAGVLINFPIAFPNAVFSVSGSTSGNPRPGLLGVEIIFSVATTTSLSAGIDTNGNGNIINNVDVQWMAIGN